jgi:hypothetical protein
VAGLSALVSAVAELEALPKAGVAQVARHLREAGLISQAGRGRSAARMTAADAANLLIGVNAARSAKDAPEVVERYRAMLNFVPVLPQDTLDWTVAERAFLLEIGFVDDFRKQGTFGDVLERLIAMAARGDLRRFLRNLGLAHIAAEDLPEPDEGAGRSPWPLLAQKLDRRRRVRAVLSTSLDHQLSALRQELRGDLDDLIRLGAAGLLVHFVRSFPAARIEVRCGGATVGGLPVGGRSLVRVDFEADSDIDQFLADQDRLVARLEVVTVNQHLLVTVGELLAGPD